MLTYTFSTREKVMLAVLAFVAIGIGWYQLVFMNIQNQIASMDADIATAQDQLVVYQTQMANLDTMRALVEDYQAQGVQPVSLPNFDNTESLMAYLHGVLSATKSYSISFNNPALSDGDGAIHRSGNINFSTGSYTDTRSVLQSISRGPYPCEITSVGISDSTRGGRVEGSCSANIQVTFFEAPSPDAEVETEDDTPEGQDLSKLKDWDK